MASEATIVVSGAPGTGKSTVARFVAEALGFPLLSLDPIKETLADLLGTGGEDWSDLLGDTAAEIVFRLNGSFPSAVVEGWWRNERRERALKAFEGCLEIFCHCEPQLAEERMRARHHEYRHPIHRDVINPEVLERAAYLARTVVPLGVGVALIEVDTTHDVDRDDLLRRVRAALEGRA